MEEFGYQFWVIFVNKNYLFKNLVFTIDDQGQNLARHLEFTFPGGAMHEVGGPVRKSGDTGT